MSETVTYFEIVGGSNIPPSIFHQLWDEAHSKKDPSQEWFDGWMDRIPASGCDCRKWLRNYLACNPVAFGPGWFEWTWKLHNAINEKKGKRFIGLDDARACWLGIAPRRSDRLVITIATGAKYIELLDVVRPSMEAYAAKCGADFLALTNQKCSHWHLEKFRVNEFAKQYEQTLYLDADCIIKPECEDLFSLYPDSVAMHDDLQANTEVADLVWARAELSAVLSSQGVKPYELQRIVNSGVVLCTDRQNPWTPPTLTLPGSHCAEQFWVDHQAGPECKFLPIEFNTQYWMKGFFDKIDAAKIVHLANAKIDERIEIAKQMVAKYCK